MANPGFFFLNHINNSLTFCFSVDTSKSKLSADAKEWYPANYTSQALPAYNTEPAPYRPSRPSVQGRLRQAQDQNPYNLDDMSYSLEEAENMDLRVSLLNKLILYFP